MERDEFDARFMEIEKSVGEFNKKLDITNELLYLLVKDTREGIPKGDNKRFRRLILGLAEHDCSMCMDTYRLLKQRETDLVKKEAITPPCDNCKLKDYKI